MRPRSGRQPARPSGRGASGRVPGRASGRRAHASSRRISRVSGRAAVRRRQTPQVALGIGGAALLLLALLVLTSRGPTTDGPPAGPDAGRPSRSAARPGRAARPQPRRALTPLDRRLEETRRAVRQALERDDLAAALAAASELKFALVGAKNADRHADAAFEMTGEIERHAAGIVDREATRIRARLQRGEAGAARALLAELKSRLAGLLPSRYEALADLVLGGGPPVVVHGGHDAPDSGVGRADPPVEPTPPGPRTESPPRVESGPLHVPDDAGPLLVRDALRKRQAGLPYQALKLARQAVADRPDSAAAHGALSVCQFDLGQFDAARAAMDRAVRGDPAWRAIARRQAAEVAFFRGDDAGCREVLPQVDRTLADRLTYLLAPDGLKRHHKRGAHYIVYTDEALRRRGGHTFAAGVMDVVFRSYTTFMPFERDRRLVHRVYVFSRTRGFQTFCARVGLDGRSSVGLYWRAARILIIDADPRTRPTNRWGFSPATINTMFHEGFHQFAHQFVVNAPLWFEEGLAEYFGPSQLISQDRLRLGVVQKTDPGGFHTRYSRIREVIETRRPLAHMPLSAFMRLPDRDWEGRGAERRAINYAQAWSLIHFLLHSRKLGSRGKTMVRTFFSELRAGKTRAEAFAAAFGKIDLDALERLWLEYVRRL